MTSGQPARGTEFLSLRHRNTAAGGSRNVVIEAGLVALISQYHKGYNITNSLKVIYRYLPPQVGTLLVYYLWLVLPFWEDLQGFIRYTSKLTAFLWPSRAELDS